MSDIAVYVAVREQADEVHCACVCNAVVFKFLPRGGIENIAAFDGFLNEFCALRINLTTTKCVVSDFAVAHIVVTGKTYRRAVRLDIGVRALFQEHIQSRRICKRNSVTESRFRLSDAVHNNQNEFLHILFVVSEIFIRLDCRFCGTLCHANLGNPFFER